MRPKISPANRTGTMLYVRADGQRKRISLRMLAVLSLSLQHGQKDTAYMLGIAPQTVKNQLTTLYQRLNVSGAFEAACALGWVVIPEYLLDPDILGRTTSTKPRETGAAGSVRVGVRSASGAPTHHNRRHADGG